MASLSTSAILARARSHGGRAWGLVDGSYWDLRGTENPGGGNATIFRLERGFSVTTGEFFDDHPFHVGLQSERFVTFTPGRQYDTMYDYFALYTLAGGAGGTAFAHPFDNDNANNSWLASNAVKVASATYGGLSAGAMYAFSNAAGRFAQNRAYGFGAHYDGGAFNAGVAWIHIDGRGASSVGAYDTSVLPGATGKVSTGKYPAWRATIALPKVVFSSDASRRGALKYRREAIKYPIKRRG